MCCCGLDSTGSGQGPVEHGDDLLGSIKVGNFLTNPAVIRFLRNVLRMELFSCFVTT
jgi:hypothetical protein